MYAFYIEEYKGSVIMSVTEWNGVFNDAEAYVDSLCPNRENLRYADAERKYKMAVCAAAESMCEARRAQTQKQSETVGNHSVSYKTKSAAEYSAEMRRRVCNFLCGTGLMYSAL